MEDGVNDVIVKTAIGIDCVERWESEAAESFQVVPGTEDDVCGRQSSIVLFFDVDLTMDCIQPAW